jgi:hypothetical protein
MNSCRTLVRESSRSSRDSLLIFLHLPKTAGSTFNRILFRQYPRQAIFRVGDGTWNPTIDDLRELPDERKSALQLVVGHISFGIHEAFPKPSRYIAFVRDPVARIVSHYRYVLRVRDHYLHDKVVSSGMSLRDYALSGLSPELDNGQVKMLVGPDDKLVEGTTDDLELAKRHILDHFALVGVTERFDESLLLFKRALAWRRLGYRRVNVAPESVSRTSIDEATLNEIRERNSLDAALHEFCLGLLEEKIAEEGELFHRDLRRFRRANAASGALLFAPRSLRSQLASSTASLRGARRLHRAS